jgi:hypothetical protein
VRNLIILVVIINAYIWEIRDAIRRGRRGTLAGLNLKNGGIMRSAGTSQSRRSGAVLLLILLLVVVLGTLLWLDPMALKRNKGTGPWNEESRIVRPDKEVPRPGQLQPVISDNLRFDAQITESTEGGIDLYILTNGRIKGVWKGTYKPKPEIMWEVVSSRFGGNIDPSKIYSDQGGEDPTKLYLIGAGNALIMETNSKTNVVRTINVKLYVTGWLDSKYKAFGKVTITSDKEKGVEYNWQGEGKKTPVVPELKKGPLGLF